jgi:uncharacterized protein YegL
MAKKKANKKKAAKKPRKKKAKKKAKKKTGPVEILLVLDGSGSMSVIRDDAIGAFNTFIEDQKKQPGKANLSLAIFNTNYELKLDGVDIKDAKPLDHSTYTPRGGTALFDAIGKSVADLEDRVEKSKIKPKGVVVAILTDGEENSSREFKREQIFELIKKRTDDGWDFAFLAAGQDAFAVGRGLGVIMSNTSGFSPCSSGIRGASAGVSNMVSHYRSGGQKAVRSSVEMSSLVKQETKKAGK